MRNTRRVPAPSRASRRGSALLIVLMFITALSLMASGFSATAGGTLATAGNDAGSLQAELLAESALEFARRRLTLDQGWSGTGGEPVTIVGRQIEVDVLGENAAGEVQLRTTGTDGVSLSMQQADVEVIQPPPPWMNTCGLITLGGALDTNNVTIRNGDALIVDDREGVLDWDPDLGQWREPAIGDPEIEAVGVKVDGDLYNYGEALPGISADQRITMEAPVNTPRWNLDPFLKPDPDTMIVNTPVLRNLTTTKTVVIHVPEGAHIELQRCNLLGGLIIYSESDRDPRGAPRNTLDWQSSNFGSLVTTGAVDGLGVFAPGTHVTHSNNQTYGYGLFLFKSADQFNNVSVTGGGVMVLDYVNQLNNVQVLFDPSMWSEELLEMMEFGSSTTDVRSLLEYYPAP